MKQHLMVGIADQLIKETGWDRDALTWYGNSLIKKFSSKISYISFSRRGKEKLSGRLFFTVYYKDRDTEAVLVKYDEVELEYKKFLFTKKLNNILE